MNRAAPIVAMLWENWRLTRVEAGQRLAVGLIAGSFALTLSASGATIAFWILIAVHSMIWLSIAKLNGGRFADGYKPGFPFYLLYTRPVPTVVVVGAAMAYDAISCVVLYLVSAALLGLAFGKPLPLLSVAVPLVSYHLAYLCCQWATRHRIVQWVGSIAFSWPMFILLFKNVQSPLKVELSLVENAVFIVIGVVSIVLTIAGVARQRRGDSVAFEPQAKAGSGGYPAWLINVLRFPCPTSSATRAQVWFELRSSGMPILMVGLAVSVVICLLFALGIQFESARTLAIGITTFCLPIALFGLGSNAFGIRRKQGRTYASAFELTQPYGTAQLAALKTLVRTACVVVAITVIGLSVWISSSLIGAWGEWTPMLSNAPNSVPGLLEARQEFAEEFGALPRFAYAALALVVCIVVAEVVAWQAAREALRARYRRGQVIGTSVLILWGFVSGLLAVAHARELVSKDVVQLFFLASFWISGAVLALSTIYLLWRGFAERVLTIRYAFGAFLLAAVVGAPWLTDKPPPSILGFAWLGLAILMINILAPWALSRARHA